MCIRILHLICDELRYVLEPSFGVPCIVLIDLNIQYIVGIIFKMSFRQPLALYN